MSVIDNVNVSQQKEVFDGKIVSMPDLTGQVKFSGYTREGFIQSVAGLYFSFADFSMEEPSVIASNALQYAELLADKLNIQ